jgi:hypothetical protein
MIRMLLLAVILAAHILPAADPSWLGSWQEVTAADDLMVFERDRCIFKNPGQQPSFGCAAYSPAGDVWVRSTTGRAHVRVKLAGDQLVIVSGGNGTYRRLAAVPPGLEIAPLVIPAAKPVSAERKAAIIAEAARRVVEDQAVRKDPARRQDMAKVDAADTAWVKQVVAEVGWPDAARFGRETATQMFLFVQHSGDLPLMLGALPCIERDLKAKVGDPQDFALLYDRVRMMTGHPQRYGSQIVPDAGGQVVFLLEDRAKVEQLRAAIGLFPLKAYLQIFEQQARTKVGFMETVRFAD